MLNFTIPLNPVTKKNSSQLITRNGKTFPIPSKAYAQYEKDCGIFIPRLAKPIDYRVNIKAVYYMKTDYFRPDRKSVIDLSNLNSALHDCLVHHGLLQDDNCRIAFTTDGSYVDFDKLNPRTEITITEI